MQPVKMVFNTQEQFLAAAKQAKRRSIVVLADTFINVYDKDKNIMIEYGVHRGDEIDRVLQKLADRHNSECVRL